MIKIKHHLVVKHGNKELIPVHTFYTRVRLLEKKTKSEEERLFG